MPDKRYVILFDGRPVEGREKEEVAANLASLLDIPVDEALDLFGEEPVMLQTNLDRDQTMDWKNKLFRTGAQFTISVQDPEDQPKPEAPQGPWKLIDCPHCGTRQQPARECMHCGQRMKKPAPA